MTIFETNLFLKNPKGVPLIFFLSKLRSPKLKKNHRFFSGWGGLFQTTKSKNTYFGLNQGGLFRGCSDWFLLYDFFWIEGWGSEDENHLLWLLTFLLSNLIRYGDGCEGVDAPGGNTACALRRSPLISPVPKEHLPVLKIKFIRKKKPSYT